MHDHVRTVFRRVNILCSKAHDPLQQDIKEEHQRDPKPGRNATMSPPRQNSCGCITLSSLHHVYQINLNARTKPKVCSTTAIIFLLLVSLGHGHTTTTPEHGETTANDSAGGDVRRQAAADLKESLLGRTVVRQKVSPAMSLSPDEDTVMINVSIVLASVLNVDDSQQIMTSTLICSVCWRDSSLSWSPSSHGEVEMIELDVDSVWTPYVFIVNSPIFQDIHSHSNHLKVLSDGSVQAVGAITVDTMCNMAHAKFPFDTQVCPIIVSTYSNQYSINMESDFMDPFTSSAMIQKSNWDLVSVNQTRLDYSAESLKMKVMEVELRRRTTFYSVCLVTPMVLTSYANTLVFLVPLQSGEKISFLVTLFVSTSVYISFFTDVMPRSLDSVPSTMKLMLGVIMETLVVLLATLLVMKRFQYEQEQAGDAALSLPSPCQSQTGDATLKTERPNTGVRGSSRVVKVAPLEEPTGEGEPVHLACAKRESKIGVTAAFLDRLFFVLTFLANTIFLCVLYYE